MHEKGKRRDGRFLHHPSLNVSGLSTFLDVGFRGTPRIFHPASAKGEKERAKEKMKGREGQREHSHLLLPL
jgi:hypothetical protein